MKKVLSTCLVLLSLLIPAKTKAQVVVDTIGFSNNLSQAAGPGGTRIVLDNMGGIHATWMTYLGGISTRTIFYNCRTGNQWLAPYVGISIDSRNYIGYGQLGVLNDNKAIIAYHYPVSGNETLFVALDMYQYLGQFEYYRAPNHLNGSTSLYPYITVDRNNRIHMASSELADSDPNYRILYYTRSLNNGISWSNPVIIDTTALGSILTASSVSDKVAIVHTRPVGPDIFTLDLWKVESQDGLAWDFNSNDVGITNYPGNDSIYATNDYDAVYDINDNLHIVWVAQKRLEQYPVGPVYLFHYDRDSGTISEIAEYEMEPDTTCQFPYRLLAMNMVSIGSSQDGRLFVSYTRFSHDDCSMRGHANGEIFVQYSTDSGLSWSDPVNISNTPTPGCTDALCQSELWPSMAEKADDYLHLVSMRYNGTYDLIYYENPMIYLRYPVSDLGIDDSGIDLPKSLNLSSYPNPFNAQTTISFSLKQAGPVTLEIYDLLGRKVETLIDKNMPAGEHKVVWEAGKYSSGIYFASLRAENSVEIRRLTLLK